MSATEKIPPTTVKRAGASIGDQKPPATSARGEVAPGNAEVPVAGSSEPRRLTPTERLHEVTMAAMTRAASPPEHSVTISRNARGIVQYEVTVRGFDPGDCLSEAERINDYLTDAYPYPATNGGTE